MVVGPGYRNLKEKIGGDEHPQGNDDDNLQRNAFRLIGLIDVAADFSFCSRYSGGRSMVSPSCTTWLAAGFLLGVWLWHIG